MVIIKNKLFWLQISTSADYGMERGLFLDLVILPKPNLKGDYRTSTKGRYNLSAGLCLWSHGHLCFGMHDKDWSWLKHKWAIQIKP